MRVAHFSDCHLAYRAYERMSGGANQREVDVANAFRSVVDGIIAARPDAVVCSGDLFDSPRPSNPAIVFAFRQFKRMREALPSAPIVIAAGNHDTQKKSETGTIFGLFDELGVEVALMKVRELVYPHLNLRIVAVPHVALMAGDAWGPTGTERYRVLVLHGEVEGVYSKFRDRPSGLVTVEAVTDPAWTYAALGDWHTRKEIGPRTFYAGSTEFVSSNMWAELDTPKGWLLVDCDSGAVDPQLIPQARPIYDLEPIDGMGLEASQVSALIAERLAAQDITNAVVRLRVLDIPRHLSRELDHKMIHAAKARALNLKIDYFVPERIAVGCTVQPRKSQSLTEGGVDFLTNRFEPSPGIDRSVLVTLFRQIMAEAEEVEMEKLTRKAGAA